MGKTVILANGSFPKRGGAAWKLLESAKRVIACDGAANAYLRRFHRAPDFIVGDLDSLSRCWKSKSKSKSNGGIVHISEQEDNDLAKAIGFCRGKGWNDLVIVGATGRREDHELGNIFRAMEAGVEVVTDYGRFIPVEKSIRLQLMKGTPISVFATDKRTKMISKGLEWPLDGVKFRNLYCATLNRSTAEIVKISSNLPFFVYIAA